MSNYIETKREVRTYLLARVPLILVDAGERERAERMLRELASELPAEISYYSDTRQVERLGRVGGSVDVDGDPLPFAAGEFRRRRGCIFALSDVRRAGDDGAYSRELLNLLYLARESGGTVILVTPDPVWPRLAQLGMMTRLDLPDLQERTGQIRRFIDAYKNRFPIHWGEEETERAAAMLRGFSEIQIENILSAELIACGGLEPERVSALTGQKRRLYAPVAAIEPVEVSEDLTVSGLDNLKRWLEEKQRIFFAPDEALRARGLGTPRGILLAGVPGCGKSLSARMTARLWSLPLFRFDIGAVYDKWVGESEKRMKQALRFLDNVAPCVVWIDELEKGLAVSDGGNDTGRRVLGQFLFWLQESASRVFLVATANDVTALPPELFRKGRFSQVFFVDLPDSAERRTVLAQYCAQALRWTPTPPELERLAAAAEGFSYADIEYAVKDLAQQALLEGDGVVSCAALLERFSAIIPFADANPETLDRLRRWGRERAVPASGEKEVTENE